MLKAEKPGQRTHVLELQKKSCPVMLDNYRKA